MLSCSLVTPYIFLSRAGPTPRLCQHSLRSRCPAPTRVTRAFALATAAGAALERRLSRSGEGGLLSLRNPDEIIEQLALLHCLDARVVLD